MTSIYIDTNVFLDLYQSAKDRMAIFHELLARAESIVVPEQTVREVRRNRAERLNNLVELVEKSTSNNIHTTAIVRDMPEFKEWEKARDAAKKQIKAIATQLRTWARDESTDPVYQEFVKLYVSPPQVQPDRVLPCGEQRRRHQRPEPHVPPRHLRVREVLEDQREQGRDHRETQDEVRRV